MSIIEAIARDYSYRRKKILHNKILKIDQDIRGLMYDLDWYKSFQIGNIGEFAKTNDAAIFEISKILKKSKIDVKIKTAIIKDGDVDISYKYLVLNNLKNSKSSSLFKMGRHLERAKVDHLELDLFGNAYNGRGGYFMSSESKMSLSRNTILQILKEDLPGFVFKHEAAHAYFKNQRVTNPTSLFHSSYMAIRDAEVYDQGLYRKYMSLEELYNYANNLFWSLDAIKSNRFLDKKGAVENSFKLFDTLLRQLDETTKQVLSMTNKSYESLLKLKESPISVYQTAWGSMKNGSIGVMIEENVITTRIIMREDENLIETATQLDRFIKENNIPTFIDNTQWDEGQVPENLREEFFSMYRYIQDGEKRIFDRYIAQDIEVRVLSEKLQDESRKMKEVLKSLKEKYHFYTEGQLSKKEMELALIDFRQRTRQLGMIVR